jgi:Protein of unknown function (DUF982).
MTLPSELVEQWAEPVYVQVAMRTPQIIRNPADALRFLANDWTGSRDKHQFAREICAAALLHQVSSETARDAFVGAALDANINTCAPEAADNKSLLSRG